MRKLSSKALRKNLFYTTVMLSLFILISFQNCGRVRFSSPKAAQVVVQSCGSIVMTPSSSLYSSTDIKFEVVVPTGVTITSINWDFSRALTTVFSSTMNPVNHTFDNPNEGSGDYVATATFTKDDGNSCELSSSFQILSSDLCVNPSGISGPTIGYVGEETSGFTINFEDCFNGTVVWDMNNDGTPEYTVPNSNIRDAVTFTYLAPGVYTVKATVNNSDDQSQTVLTHAITIGFKNCINPFTNQVVPHGQSVQFAKPDVTCGSKPCLKINRTCNNGVFGGDASYNKNPATCPVSSACPIPINGSCGTTNNSCVAGTLSDKTDTATQYLWSCNGSNGGTNASCSLNKPVNGSCGTTNNSCVTGTLSDKTDTATQYLWSCNGSNGGTNASCALNKPTYSWSTGAWGACSATACGTTGTHTRTVVCKQNNGNTVADSFCTGTKPATSQACSAPACTCGIQNTSGPCEVEYWCSGVYKKTVNPVTVASVIDPANVIYNPGQTINGFSSPGYTTLINNYSYICNAQGNWQSNTSNGYCKLRKDNDTAVCSAKQFAISTCGFSLVSSGWSGQAGQPTTAYNSCEWAGWLHIPTSNKAAAVFYFGDYYDASAGLVRLNNPSDWTLSAVGCTLGSGTRLTYCSTSDYRAYNGSTPLVWKATITARNKTTGEVITLPITATFKPTLQ